MGFRILEFWSRHPAIQTTGLLTFAPAGLSPAEHTSLYWSQLPYGRFSRVRLEGWLIRRGLPGASVRLSPLPACADRRPFAFALRAPRGQPRLSRTEPGRGLDNAPPWRVGCPPPQGSSLRIGLCCPSPSSLNRPHPPRSQAHRDFTALRLIRDAFAVRERLGDPLAIVGIEIERAPL